MMNIEKPQLEKIEKYFDLFLSRHKLIIAIFLLAVSAGTSVYLVTPKVYQSTASIIYQEQKISPSKFSPDEEKQIREMVNTVTQQVMSRTNLEKIIQDFNLYPDLRATVPIEDIIERMREKSIKISVQREKGNVFSVSFQGEEPGLVMRVTNALAAKFIEENLHVREERASETTSYIKDELRMSKEVLGKKEALMRDYKLKYYNAMPDQQAANIARLNALQEQFQAVQSNIHTLEQTRLLVSEQIGIQKNLQRAAADLVTRSGVAQKDALAEARETLRSLLTRYTDAHPSVKRIKKEIARLETEQAISSLPDIRYGLDRNGGIALDPQHNGANDFSIQLQEIDLNLKTLRSKSGDILHQIEKFQAWIDSVPVREAEWAALTRDYDELKKYHDMLLSQSLAAQAAESLEIRQKGSQFKIIDPAYLPETPVKGKFLKFLIISIGLGLAAGFGLVFGLDILNPSFKSTLEIENLLRVPVTCSLPVIITEIEKRRLFGKNCVCYGLLLTWLFALFSAAGYFWIRGTIVL